METDPTATRPSVLRSPRRLLLAVLGVVCVGVALAGIVLPGLPTTIFLIAASYLFTRSCPWLEDRLIKNRVFSPFLRYMDGSRPMPLRARIAALLLMWTAVLLSVRTVGFDDPPSKWTSSTILLAACVGTVVISTVRRNVRS